MDAVQLGVQCAHTRTHTVQMKQLFDVDDIRLSHFVTLCAGSPSCPVDCYGPNQIARGERVYVCDVLMIA